MKKEGMEIAVMEGGNMSSYRVHLNYGAMNKMNKKRLQKYLRSLRDHYYADKEISSKEEVDKLKNCIDYGFSILNSFSADLP